MAIRKIRVIGDEILTKQAREIKLITPKIRQLAEDMLETMYDAGGVGLAAPQVGVLRRLVVIDIEDGSGPLIMINPVILSEEGEKQWKEGCLSVPGKYGYVNRPQKVLVRALDLDGTQFELEAVDFLAEAVSHECDHLNGIVYTSRIIGELHDVGDEEEEDEDAEEENA